MRLNYANNFQYAWVSVGVAGASALVSGYKSIRANAQDKEAAKEGAALKRPFEQVQPEYYQIKNLAEENASGGFTSAEKQYTQDQRERGLTTSLSALKQTGAGPNDFAGLDEVFSGSLRSEAADDARMHLQNINLFSNASKDLAAQKTIQWGVNEKEPFETKLNEIMGRRVAAKTNENNATDELLGSLSAAGTGINSYMNNKARGTPPPDATPYTRNFGLAPTAGPVGSPAAGIASINPNAGTGVIAQ